MIAVSVIASAIKKELGSYFSTEAHKDNDIVRYINSAVRAIVIAKNFDFNQYKYKLTVVPWEEQYNIPYQIETFYVKKSWENIDFLDFKDYNNVSDKSNYIWIWWDVCNCVSPWEYEIFYRWFPSQIFWLNESLEIPAHFFDLVLLKATYFGFMDIRAYDKANHKNNIFEWMIDDMATRSSTPQPTKTKRLNKSKKKIW